MLLRVRHCCLDVEAPSTTKALENTTKEKQISAEVMIDDIEQNEAPVSAEWNGEKETSKSDYKGNESFRYISHRLQVLDYR